MKAKLLKPMVVNGESLEAGSVVDVSGWRNYRSLESMRYLAFILDEEVKEEVKVEKPKATKAKTEEVREISLS
jgi:hypothetical protein